MINPACELCSGRGWIGDRKGKMCVCPRCDGKGYGLYTPIDQRILARVGIGNVVSLYVNHQQREIWGELVAATATEVSLIGAGGPVFVTTDEISAFRRCDSKLTIREDLREKYRGQARGKRWEDCPQCDGGREAVGGSINCETCHGERKVQVKELPERDKCPDCGTFLDLRCGTCGHRATDL
jgi:hypothetical protein